MAKRPIATKKVVKAPPSLLTQMDLYVYRHHDTWNDDQVYVFRENPLNTPIITVDFVNGLPQVDVQTTLTKDQLSKANDVFCRTFMSATGCGELPKDTLFKWSITAAPVSPVDAKALQKQVLETALKKLEAQ